MSEEAHGGCLCGAVSFSFSLPSKFVAHCHCSLCRRTSGAPFVTWVGTWEPKLVVKDPQNSLRTFTSSPGATRQFCAQCGSHLFFRSARWPDEVHVTRASIPGAVDRLPVAHVFYSDKADWVEPDKVLPKYGGKSGVEPLADLEK